MAISKERVDRQTQYARDNMATDQIRKSIKMGEKMRELARERVEECEEVLNNNRVKLDRLKAELVDAESVVVGLKAALKERGHKA